MKLFIKMQAVVEDVVEIMVKVHEAKKDVKLIDTVFVVHSTWNEYRANEKEIGRPQEILIPSPPITPLKQVVFPSIKKEMFHVISCKSESSCGLVFGSIDITNKSSFSYSFAHELASDPFRQFQPLWYASLTGYKTKTDILIAPDGKTLVEYGNNAETKYFELIETGQHASYY